MGIFRQNRRGGKAGKAVDQVLRMAREREAQGLTEFSVSLTQSDIGVLNRLDVMTPVITTALQDAGFSVIDVNSEPWSHAVTFAIRGRSMTRSAGPGNAALGRDTAGADPDLMKLRRELAAADEQPAGEVGKGLSAGRLGSELDQFVEWFEAGDLDAVWVRRLQLGYGVNTDQLDQPSRFWFNALPALAALRLGHKDHPFVATCCGLADQICDPSDAQQAAAKRDFEAMYFA